MQCIYASDGNLICNESFSNNNVTRKSINFRKRKPLIPPRQRSVRSEPIQSKKTIQTVKKEVVEKPYKSKEPPPKTEMKDLIKW